MPPTPLAAPPAACPMHAAADAGVQPGDRLVLPLGRRMVVQRAQGDAGPELRLYHEAQEISFDDPAMFAFGEALAAQHVFAAGAATGWGAGYDWLQVAPLLGQLVEAGVLRRLAPGEPEPPPRPFAQDLARPSPLPPAPSARPREWRDAEALFEQLTGRALDPAFLELVVPVFRVAHMSVDAEGRQVGEANVFPPALRIEVATRWRTCIYDGTRHLADKPMNVAALRSMRAQWPRMMALLLKLRAAYLARYPAAAAGWTVGHLERLATGVLALPTWLLMTGRVANGALHPALSSLFRVTDGLRMVMHQMLFVPVGEPARHPDDPMSAAEVHAYAERNYSFHSDHGVCAGPRAMVDEFLAVLIDGRTPRDGLPDRLDPALDEAVAAIDDALSYGLRGLQAYAVVFSMWPLMVRGYEALAEAAAVTAAAGTPESLALQRRLDTHVQALREGSYLSTEARRLHRDRVYADMLAQCSAGLGEPVGASLSTRLLPWRDEADDRAEAALEHALQRVAGPGADVAGLRSAVLDHLRRTRALLAEAQRVQCALNTHLGRAAPRRALQAADLDLHNRLLGAAQRPLPFLIDELQSILGLEITVTPESIDVTPPIGRHVADRNPAHAVRTH